MNSVTKKWLFMKISSIILVPLMIWFILNLISIFDKDYIQNEKIKNAANKVLNIFAIIVPIITITVIFNLN